MTFAEHPAIFAEVHCEIDSAKGAPLLVGRAGFEPATNGLKGPREVSENQALSPDSVPQTSVVGSIPSLGDFASSSFCGIVSRKEMR